MGGDESNLDSWLSSISSNAVPVSSEGTGGTWFDAAHSAADGLLVA